MMTPKHLSRLRAYFIYIKENVLKSNEAKFIEFANCDPLKLTQCEPQNFHVNKNDSS